MEGSKVTGACNMASEQWFADAVRSLYRYTTYIRFSVYAFYNKVILAKFYAALILSLNVTSVWITEAFSFPEFF